MFNKSNERKVDYWFNVDRCCWRRCYRPPRLRSLKKRRIMTLKIYYCKWCKLISLAYRLWPRSKEDKNLQLASVSGLCLWAKGANGRTTICVQTQKNEPTNAYSNCYRMVNWCVFVCVPFYVIAYSFILYCVCCLFRWFSVRDPYIIGPTTKMLYIAMVTDWKVVGTMTI